MLTTTSKIQLERVAKDRPTASQVLAIAKEIEDKLLSEVEELGLDIRVTQDAQELFNVLATLIEKSASTSSLELTEELKTHISYYIRANLIGAGPLEFLLKDSTVWEVEIVAPQRVFVRRRDGSRARVYLSFYDDNHVERIVGRLLDSSMSSQKKLDPALGVQDAQLPDGSRVHVVHPELVAQNHMLVNIRKFQTSKGVTLGDLENQGFVSNDCRDFLTHAIANGASVVISGAPGSGKTTLLKAILNSLPGSSRIVSAEEVLELDCAVSNFAQMQTRPRRADRAEVDLRTLSNAFLRMTPDVVVIGEVRDRETLPFLLTLSTGLQGFTTLHARSARHALERLRLLSQLSERPITATTACQLVGDSLDLVVHCQRDKDSVGVTEVIAVEDPQAVRDSWIFSSTQLFFRSSLRTPLEATSATKTRLDLRVESRS